MAKSLQRLWSHGGSLRSAFAPMSRPFSADALVEIKPGEIGMVSGIPEEHLRRRGIRASFGFKNTMAMIGTRN
ncbi:hypothetical protein CK203_000767 [Vitis vinifera]|uniref:Uncharacterized protein n=1 Tax=Vitis vinifera TaxID=29760 RepID=A0A438FCD8_VITVI|nr:hypothetical protein CK203_089574 [Vitis vinifera]RVX23858.1 hypothetical protein CK203_000767 [Vitis vinifera]